jgi:hypothetical protein
MPMLSVMQLVALKRQDLSTNLLLYYAQYQMKSHRCKSKSFCIMWFRSCTNVMTHFTQQCLKGDRGSRLTSTSSDTTTTTTTNTTTYYYLAEILTEYHLNIGRTCYRCANSLKWIMQMKVDLAQKQ